MKFSFFIYLSHLIIVLGASKILTLIVNKFDIQSSHWIDNMYLAFWLVIPISSIIVLCAFAKFIKKYIPNIWALVCGARG